MAQLACRYLCEHHTGRADSPAAYLRTALVNASSNWNRRSRTMREKLPLLARSDRVELNTPELADAIARLPFRQRAVIIMRYHADLSETEIAEALDCRRGTVKSLAHAGRGRQRDG